MKVLILTFDEGEETRIEEILSLLADRRKLVHLEIDAPATRSFPGLEIRVREQAVLCQGISVHLSHYEFFTLWFLTEHPGWVFTRKQIYEAVWNEPGDACGAAVASVISQLRRKLWPENPLGGYIRTVHNSGYKFEA